MVVPANEQQRRRVLQRLSNGGPAWQICPDDVRTVVKDEQITVLSQQRFELNVVVTLRANPSAVACANAAAHSADANPVQRDGRAIQKTGARSI